MDARAQLDAERDRLEAELLDLEQQRLRLMSEDGDAVDSGLRIESLLSSLGLVNAELAAIRQRDDLGRSL
jgi:hypothetical protein